MLLHLTDLSDESLQNQIIRQIRALILSGDFSAGSSLPSIRALSREQKVSVITVQRAYEQLLREELIHSRRGKGFFVSELPSARRKTVAVERLYQNLQRPIREAISEGVPMVEIQKLVSKIVRSESAK